MALLRVSMRTGAACLAMRIGRDEHRRGSIFRPRRGLLPRKILLYALRLNLITAPVSFLEVQHAEMAQVFTGSMTN